MGHLRKFLEVSAYGEVHKEVVMQICCKQKMILCFHCVAEITAANVANVCTFAVMGDMDIDQTVTTVYQL